VVGFVGRAAHDMGWGFSWCRSWVWRLGDGDGGEVEVAGM